MGPGTLSAQDSLPLNSVGDKTLAGTEEMRSQSVKRQWLVAGGSAAVYGGSLFALNNAWYKNYPKTSFHTFNDAAEWLQVDKIGHAWSAYNLSRAATAMWRWAYRPQASDGKREHAVLLGTVTGFSYLTVIEFLDAHSANWGWSWADMGANLFGSGLFASQEWIWKEQRILFKFSAHRNSYEPALRARANELYGTSLPERLLKDYNAQTYWLSFNLRSFLKKSSLPQWLSLSIGYGADGLFGGFENRSYDKDGNLVFDRSDIPRQRHWYLSPDIDWSRIPTRSRFLRTTFSILNAIKVPAPALEFSAGAFRFKAIAF